MRKSVHRCLTVVREMMYSHTLYSMIAWLIDLLVDLRNSIAAQISHVTRVVSWIRTSTSNDELWGDISRCPVTAQLLDFLVAHGSSVAAQCNELMMVDVWLSVSVLGIAGR